MKITKALFVPGSSAFYFDDQRAIKDGAGHDGFFYTGAPATPHFKTVRIAGETVSILLLLEDGSVAAGDCAAVQYSGAGGRDPLFLAADYLPLLQNRIRPLLEGRTFNLFEALVDELHGLSQVALLGQRLREDRVTEADAREQNMSNAPAAQDGLFLVPRVVE